MKWIVTSAWPYAHGTPHLGNIVSSLLSADIFNRFLKLKGYETIMVSGSDEHGSPIEIKAIKAGLEPKQLTDKVHNEILDVLRGFNIEFDNYTRTHNPVHIEYVREVFRKIYENGYIFTKEDELLYCEKDRIYLPDRFVVGTCPYCKYDSAKGDQCENCGKLLDPLDLINPRCAVCGSRPVIRKVRHFYFDLPRFEETLRKWLEKSDTLSENSKNFSLQMIKQGLKPRSVTRNLRWGVPAPFPNSDDLTIYVWFDAVLGYVSAVKEYFKRRGDEDRWKDFWMNQDVHVAFFIGKDNIPFHTIIFPALLLATHDPYTLKFHIGATEWLQFEGQKFSKSKGIGIWGDEAIKLLPADYWRYTLTYIRPETKDTDFKWDILEHCVNKELNDNIGNLIHRILNLIKRYSGNRVKFHEPVTERQKTLKELNFLVAEKVEKDYMNMRFQRVLFDITQLVGDANSIINDERPWEIKDEKDKLLGLLYVLTFTARNLAIMLYPIIPETSQKIFKYFNFNLEQLKWDTIYQEFDETTIDPNFKPLFTKIDKNDLKRKLNEIRGISMEEKIDISTFQKIDLRVGTIVKAERKEGSRNLIRLYIDLGDKQVKVLAGLAKYYTPEEMMGKKVVVVANLKEKKFMGETSEGMILAADDGKGNVKLITVDGEIENGSKVR